MVSGLMAGFQTQFESIKAKQEKPELKANQERQAIALATNSGLIFNLISAKKERVKNEIP